MGGTVANGNDMTNLFNINTTAGLFNGGSTMRSSIPSANDCGSVINYSRSDEEMGINFSMPPGNGCLVL